MKADATAVPEFLGTLKRLARGLSAMGTNRLELFTLEMQEARVRSFQFVLVAFGVAGFCLLAAMALTALIVVLFWEHSPAIVLAILTLIYGGAGSFLFMRLTQMQRDWHTFPATLEQLKKDCECLDQRLN